MTKDLKIKLKIDSLDLLAANQKLFHKHKVWKASCFRCSYNAWCMVICLVTVVIMASQIIVAPGTSKSICKYALIYGGIYSYVVCKVLKKTGSLLTQSHSLVCMSHSFQA